MLWHVWWGACYVFLGEERQSVQWVAGWGASTAAEGAGVITCAVFFGASSLVKVEADLFPVMEGAVLLGPAVGV